MPRCRWYTDDGQCLNGQAHPDTPLVPPFCNSHLGEMRPWIGRVARMLIQSGEIPARKPVTPPRPVRLRRGAHLAVSEEATLAYLRRGAA